MSRRIFDTPLAALLPESIRNDAGIAATAEALDPALRKLVHGVPNLLLFSRLDPKPGRLSPPLQRLTDAAGGLRPLSESELELLAWQFHVDFREVARTQEELAAMVRDSIPWHRIKGTPASLRAAFGLFGWTAQIEEDGEGEYWATYQLGLPEITDMDTVRRIVTVANAMAPVRCRLWRIYTDEFDRRPIRPTRGPKLGDGWLTFYSGLPVSMPDGDDILVSFGSSRRFESDPFAPADACVGAAHMMLCGILAPYIDKFIVGISRLGDEFPRNHCFAISGLFSGFMGEPELNGRKWVGPWVDTWIGEPSVAGCDRKLPPWRMESRRASFSQLSVSEGRVLGDENARLGVSAFTLIDTPGRLGDMRLGKHVPGRHVIRIHKFFIETTRHSTPAVNPSPDIPMGIGGETAYATDTLRGHPDGWRGPWSQRRWWPYVSYAAVGEIGLHSELHRVLHSEVPDSTRVPETLFAAA